MVRLFLATVLLLSPAALLAADPFLGRWTLDVHSSKYPPGTCPKQMTIEMSAQGQTVHYHSEAQLTNGRLISADYNAAYDGKPVMVRGIRSVLLPVSLKRIAPRVVVATYTRGFQVLATSRRSLSVDGKTMTITTTSRDPHGKSVTNVGVYRRATPDQVSTSILAKIKPVSPVPQ